MNFDELIEGSLVDPISYLKTIIDEKKNHLNKESCVELGNSLISYCDSEALNIKKYRKKGIGLYDT